jgi:hypothetical protein
VGEWRDDDDDDDDDDLRIGPVSHRFRSVVWFYIVKGCHGTVIHERHFQHDSPLLGFNSDEKIQQATG